MQIEEEKLSEHEREWLFFKSHDKDNSTSLDGIEILQAIRHIQNEHKTAEDMKNVNVTEELGTLVEHIDRTMESMDLNKDGYLDYMEYQIATRKRHEDDKREAEEANAKKQEN